jgi:hypothetical protein
VYKKQKKILISSYQQSCAWIFTGSKNEQKFKIANDFATWVLKDDKSKSDLLIVQKDKIKIEDAHQIHSFINLTAGQSKYKVIIIDNFHNITNSASNSLLKILEEPKQDLIIIIITNLYKILPTIRSRCFILNFPSVYNHTENIIENYKSILNSIILTIPFKTNLEHDLIAETLLLTFSRVIKFQHNIILNEIFVGEFEMLKQLKKDKIFWHCKYKQALNLIKDCIEYHLNFDYAFSILLNQSI